MKKTTTLFLSIFHLGYIQTAVVLLPFLLSGTLVTAQDRSNNTGRNEQHGNGNLQHNNAPVRQEQNRQSNPQPNITRPNPQPQQAPRPQPAPRPQQVPVPQRDNTVSNAPVRQNYNRPYQRNNGNIRGGNRPGLTTQSNRSYDNNRRGYGNYNRNPVYDAHNPSWRYHNLPSRNSVRYTVPTSYRTLRYGGFDYRYNNGIYYRRYNNSFIVTAPPIGIFINIMPFGYRQIYVQNRTYYYYNGSYYDYRDDNYYVVSPPVGAVVESIPDGYETLTIDGETYYAVDGAQYKPVVQDNGEIWYEVVKSN
jgi:hypothetical protein